MTARRSGGGLRAQPWRLTILAVVVLVLGLVAVGVIGLVVNERIGRVVADAIAYDIELEEEADELRATAERYYGGFRPALESFLAGDLERAAFDEASDRGLVELGRLDGDALTLDRLGEALGEAAFVAIENERQAGFFVLGGVIAGLSLVGMLVGFGAVLMVREARRLLTVADQAAQAKDDFIADASHELRTPLTVLRGNAEQALVLGTRSPPELYEDIASESVRMSRIVDDLLLLATSDAAGLPLNVERLEAEPFLVEVAARARALVEEHGSSLAVGGLPDATLDIDPVRIEQAIRILVDNAAKYGRGSPVGIQADVVDGSLRLSVSDEGPGIPPEAVPHIFERFYRTDRTRSRSSGGAGLGLAIAQSIVTAHGGRIEVDSQPGRGTTMTIVLPRTRT